MTDYYKDVSALFAQQLSEELEQTLREYIEQTRQEDNNRMREYVYEQRESVKAYFYNMPEFQELQKTDPVAAQKWEEYAMVVIDSMTRRMLPLCD